MDQKGVPQVDLYPYFKGSKLGSVLPDESGPGFTLPKDHLKIKAVNKKFVCYTCAVKTYFYALLVLAFLLAFHSLGISQNYYMYIWPYDIVAHILGGLGIGLFVTASLQTFWPSFLVKNRWLKIALIVLLVGLAWEAFEVYFNIAGYPFGTKPYYIDTVKDLIDDVIGGFISIYITRIKGETV